MSDGADAKLPARERREPVVWRPGSELTPLEEEMVASADAGELVDYGGGPFSLAAMQEWGPEWTVRAAVLRHLLIGKDWPTDARGVRLRGVRIGGPLDLEAAILHCPLYLDSCFLDAELVCLDQASATVLTITRCQLAGLTGELLTANSLDLSGSTLTGPLRLPGASMTGALSCRGAHLTGCDNDGNALVADGIRAGGEGVLLDNGFTAAGAVRLARADITGALICGGARLTSSDKDRRALVADGIKVSFDVFLDDGFAAAGTISLLLADITGMLSCRNARLTGRDNDGLSLAAYGIQVSGDVWLDKTFTATGGISLRSARIGRKIWLKGKLAADENDLALDAEAAQIADTFLWAPAEQVAGRVSLDGAAVGELDDDWTSANGFWPTHGRLSVKGFTYNRVGGAHPATIEQRLNWIRSQYPDAAQDAQAEFATQPYEQLAAVCRRAGQDAAARKVAIARRADLRRYGKLNTYASSATGCWIRPSTMAIRLAGRGGPGRRLRGLPGSVRTRPASARDRAGRRYQGTTPGAVRDAVHQQLPVLLPRRVHRRHGHPAHQRAPGRVLGPRRARRLGLAMGRQLLGGNRTRLGPSDPARRRLHRTRPPGITTLSRRQQMAPQDFKGARTGRSERPSIIP
jgi:hypothetical protein